jgi:DNA-binding Lrp family transcriptional regulator
VLSYILLSVDRDMKQAVKSQLAKYEFTVDTVKEIDGKYNIIARVITDNNSRLQAFISERIDPLGGITKIETIKV